MTTANSDELSNDEPPHADIEEMSWNQASAELRSLVDELDDPSLDIDLLAGKIERAAFLIGVCRARIDRARDQISGVIADFDG